MRGGLRGLEWVRAWVRVSVYVCIRAYVRVRVIPAMTDDDWTDGRVLRAGRTDGGMRT